MEPNLRKDRHQQASTPAEGAVASSRAAMVPVDEPACPHALGGDPGRHRKCLGHLRRRRGAAQGWSGRRRRPRSRSRRSVRPAPATPRATFASCSRPGSSPTRGGARPSSPGSRRRGAMPPSRRQHGRPGTRRPSRLPAGSRLIPAQFRMADADATSPGRAARGARRGDRGLRRPPPRGLGQLGRPGPVRAVHLRAEGRRCRLRQGRHRPEPDLAGGHRPAGRGELGLDGAGAHHLALHQQPDRRHLRGAHHRQRQGPPARAGGGRRRRQPERRPAPGASTARRWWAPTAPAAPPASSSTP